MVEAAAILEAAATMAEVAYYGGGVGIGVYGGSGWYGNPYGYGGNYGYYQPATPYVVQRPIIENPTFSGLPIEITNPATSGATLSYVLNDVTYSIPPGYSQNLTLDRSWVISFSRGGNFGPARYGLEPACTRLPTRIMVGNCITGMWRSPASCKRRRIRCR